MASGALGRGLAVALGLVGLVTFAYWPSFGGGFVWDDLVLVKSNPLATGAFNLKTIWLGADFSLSTTVTWLEWLVFGENAAGYRIVNALLHATSVLLFWRLLVRLAIPGAWLGAAIFAVHPVAVASVAWISELKNTLSLPFFLLSLLAFLKFERTRTTQQRGRVWWWYGAAWGWFVLALLAKTSTVVLPIFLLGLVAQRRRLTRKDIMNLLPFFVTAAFFGGMTMWFQAHQAIRGLTVQNGNFLERLADAGTAIWFYLSKTLLPVNLCAIYSSWEKSLPGLVRFLPLVVLIGAMALGWHYRKGGGRVPLLAGGAFLVTLLPVCGLVDMYFMVFARVSDHFAYLALVIIAATIGAIVAQIRSGRWRQGTGFILITGLVLLTQTRAKIYATDEALWRDTVQKNPDSGAAQNNLACNLAERGKLAEAMQHFAKAAELTPNNAQAHLNLGKGLTMLGRFPEAEPHFQRAREIKPDDAEIMVGYGQALTENGRWEDAAQQIGRAVEIQPSTTKRLLLAAIFTKAGKQDLAAGEYRRVLTTEPKSIEALNNLAWILATASKSEWRDGQEAKRLAEEACGLTRNQEPQILSTLAAAFAEMGDFTNAVQVTQNAIRRAEAMPDKEIWINRQRQLLALYQSGRAYPLKTSTPNGSAAR